MTENKKEPDVKDVKEFYENAFDNPVEHSNRERAGRFASLPSEEYQRELMKKIHPELMKMNFGCGSPFPSGELTGFNVLDLGAGAGRDCFIMSKLVGDTGSVVGVDISDKVVELANTYKKYHQETYGLKNDVVDFRQGNIEDLKSSGIKDESMDLVISNCVVNLAKSKENVFKEIFRALKYGGELYFSDIYTSARLGKATKANKELWGSCYSGALYVSDFAKLLRTVGFSNIQVVSARIAQKAKLLKELESNTLFFSITLRAFKLRPEDIEDSEEDYGHTATFLGDQFGDSFLFKYKTRFMKGETMKISGNTASILGRSKYSKYFDISDGTVHLGRFRDPYGYWGVLDEITRNTDLSKIGKKKCTKGVCMLKPEEEEEEEVSCCGGKKKKVEKSSCCGGKKEKVEESCCSEKKEESCCGGKKEESCCSKKEETCCSEKKEESCCSKKEESCCSEKKEESCCGGKKEEKSCCGGKKEVKSCCT